MENLIILGSGPGGLAAGIYAGRAERGPLLIAGPALGGQAATTDLIENYPGFPDGVQGAELAQLFQRQAEKFGTRIVYDEVIEVNFRQFPFTVRTYSETYETRSVIISTGVTSRKLGVPGERELTGRGVSYCATCDGFFYKDKVIGVVGGGDAAVDEALFLTRYASELHLIHRRNRLRANPTSIRRLTEHPKARFVWNSVVTRVHGEGEVAGVSLKDVETGEESELKLDGLFVYIGQIPRTELFKGQIDLDEAGFVVIDRLCHTNVPGVYAAGDVTGGVLRQVVTAAGAGATAAMEADKWLEEMEGEAYPGRV
jgi:thioredoxin reductase (NADPH)